MQQQVDVVEQFLEQVRVDLASQMLVAGLPTSGSLPVPVLDSVQTSGYRSWLEPRNVSALRFFHGVSGSLELAEALEPAADAAAVRLVGDDNYRPQIGPWPSAPGYQGRSTGVRDLLIRAALNYSLGLRDLNEQDPADLQGAVADVMFLLTSEQIVKYRLLPVGGIAPVDGRTLRIGPYRLRRLRAEELADLAPPLSVEEVLRPRALPARSAARVVERSMVEFAWEAPAEGFVEPTLGIWRMLVALQCLGHDLAGRGSEYFKVQPALAHFAPGSDAMSSSPWPLRHEPWNWQEEAVLTEHDWRRAVALAERVPPDLASGYDARALALRRFLQGCARRDPADALLDFSIVLEILTDNESKGEIAYQFRMRLAWFIGDSALERTQLRDDFKMIYDLRSALVHGTKLAPQKPKHDVRRISNLARELTGRCLTNALKNGWPTNLEHDARLLGEGVQRDAPAPPRSCVHVALPTHLLDREAEAPLTLSHSCLSR